MSSLVTVASRLSKKARTRHLPLRRVPVSMVPVFEGPPHACNYHLSDPGESANVNFNVA